MMSAKQTLRAFSYASLAAILLAVTSSAALAVPAFARKYQTSCQTCHIVFPKLNAFGEAFRLRGYRMPGETPDMVKEPQVSLGAPAYKRLWPQAVWPGEVSSSVPLAVNIKLADVNTSTLNEDGTTTSVKNDLQFPQEVNLFGAGTLGDHVSYLGEVTFGENPDGSVAVELEHARLQFDSPFEQPVPHCLPSHVAVPPEGAGQGVHDEPHDAGDRLLTHAPLQACCADGH